MQHGIAKKQDAVENLEKKRKSLETSSPSVTESDRKKKKQTPNKSGGKK
jgi:hypothetical protein